MTLSPDAYKETLILKTVKEAVGEQGIPRDSWPAPWISGEYRHILWQTFVTSEDPKLRRLAADIFLDECEWRLVYAWGEISRYYEGEEMTPEVFAITRDLEEYVEKVRRKYFSVFGACCQSGIAETLVDNVNAGEENRAEVMATAAHLTPPALQRRAL